tara:strand:+ start:720 stop:1727 length:1008 start_codon:yes stop_codon:yes gene_type:complete
MKKNILTFFIVLLFISPINAISLNPETIKKINSNYQNKKNFKSYTYIGLGGASLTVSAISNPAFLGIAIPLLGYGTYLKFLDPSPYLLEKNILNNETAISLYTYSKFNRYKNSTILLGLSMYTYMMMNNDIFETELSESLSNSLPLLSTIPLSLSIINFKRKTYIEKILAPYNSKSVSSLNSLKIVSKVSCSYRKKSSIRNIAFGIIGSSIALSTNHTNLLIISSPLFSVGLYDYFFANSLVKSYKTITELTEQDQEKKASLILKSFSKKTKSKRIITALGFAGASYFFANQRHDEYLIQHELQALSFITGSLAIFNFSYSWPLETITKSFSDSN